MNKRVKKIILIHSIVIALVIIFYKLNIRVCLFYNLFHMPCVGCGLSRGIYSLLSGDILTAIKYNFLSVIIGVTYIILVIWFILDILRKKQTLNIFIIKYKKIIIIFAIVITVIAWTININNQLLY